MSATAIALRPKLLLLARELCGRRDVDAEGLVSALISRWSRSRQNPHDATELHHWLRTALRNRAARAYGDRYRRAEDVTIESLDVLNGWAG